MLLLAISVSQEEQRGIVSGLFSGRREEKRRKDRGSSGQAALLLQRLSFRRTGALLVSRWRGGKQPYFLTSKRSSVIPRSTMCTPCCVSQVRNNRRAAVFCLVVDRVEKATTKRLWLPALSVLFTLHVSVDSSSTLADKATYFPPFPCLVGDFFSSPVVLN